MNKFAYGFLKGMKRAADENLTAPDIQSATPTLAPEISPRRFNDPHDFFTRLKRNLTLAGRTIPENLVQGGYGGARSLMDATGLGTLAPSVRNDLFATEGAAEVNKWRRKAELQPMTPELQAEWQAIKNKYQGFLKEDPNPGELYAAPRALEFQSEMLRHEGEAKDYQTQQELAARERELKVRGDINSRQQKLRTREVGQNYEVTPEGIKKIQDAGTSPKPGNESIAPQQAPAEAPVAQAAAAPTQVTPEGQLPVVSAPMTGTATAPAQDPYKAEQQSRRNALLMSEEDVRKRQEDNQRFYRSALGLTGSSGSEPKKPMIKDWSKPIENTAPPVQAGQWNVVAPKTQVTAPPIGDVEYAGTGDVLDTTKNFLKKRD
jgi:hypothetical protein